MFPEFSQPFRLAPGRPSAAAGVRRAARGASRGTSRMDSRYGHPHIGRNRNVAAGRAKLTPATSLASIGMMLAAVCAVGLLVVVLWPGCGVVAAPSATSTPSADRQAQRLTQFWSSSLWTNAQQALLKRGREKSVAIARMPAGPEANASAAAARVPHPPTSPAGRRLQSGACEGAGDVEICSDLGTDGFRSNMTECGIRCLGRSKCVTNCMLERFPLTQDCAECFGAIAGCARSNCFFPCSSGSNPRCDACVSDNCNPGFVECTGPSCGSYVFPTPPSPPPAPDPPPQSSLPQPRPPTPPLSPPPLGPPSLPLGPLSPPAPPLLSA